MESHCLCRNYENENQYKKNDSASVFLSAFVRGFAIGLGLTFLICISTTCIIEEGIRSDIGIDYRPNPLNMHYPKIRYRRKVS